MIDAARFEGFVREYQDMVFATAVRLLGRPADAEDIAQTVFLKAYERFDEIGASPSAAGWLKTVTTNLCLNQLSRDRSRWTLFSELGRAGDGPESNRFEASLVSGDSHAAAFERADDHARLERALRALPDHQRVPLVLFHFEEKSYQEIASLLHRSLAKVKTDIHRGREALRSQLEAGHGSR
jgi:RNA polymerase sigma-70 factor (ECF subfamily)